MQQFINTLLIGISIGSIYALMALALVLVWRSTRVVNFAQADLGAVPTAFAAAFILFWGWPYLLGLGAGLALAVVLGVVVEMAIIRRFQHAPRLVLTVATLGITQLLVFLGILGPWQRHACAYHILGRPASARLVERCRIHQDRHRGHGLPRARGYARRA